MSTKRPKYKITIDDLYSNGEDLGISKIAHTATPAILKKGFAFNEHVEVKPKNILFADDLKYRISGPIMKAMDIYRNDDGEEYEVTFTKEVMDEMFQKFMSKLNNTNNNFNDEHLDIDAPSYILYAWTEDDGNEIWVTTQFRDKEVFNEYVEAGKTGYSIEGFLGMEMSEVIKQKMKNKMKKNDFNLAPGEYPMQNGSLLVIAEDGSVSILENEVVLADEEVTEIEEEELADEVIVDAPVDEEEELADEVIVDAPVDEVKVDSYTKEELDAKFEEIYKMIADLKSDDVEVVEDQELNKAQALSIHEKMAMLVNFNKNTPNVKL